MMSKRIQISWALFQMCLLVFSLSYRFKIIHRFRKHTCLKMQSSNKPKVTIEYCTGCRWLLRSAWLAQELLTTFEKEIGGVTLCPDSSKPGGIFKIYVDNDIVWDRKSELTSGFPEAKVLKQIVRDKIAPQKELGHSDSIPTINIIDVPPEI